MEALAMAVFWTSFVSMLAVWLVAGGCLSVWFFLSLVRLLITGSCFGEHVESPQAICLGKAVYASRTTLDKVNTTHSWLL